MATLRHLLPHFQASHRGIPVAQLVQLGKSIHSGLSLTIDVESARSIGCPVVVVHARRCAAPSLLGRLSKREREVAGLVARGLRNEQVALELRISVATVKDHVHHILSKTGTQSRTELAACLAGA